MGNTVKNKVLMAIKRYTPKYKKLNRFRHPLFFENALKINSFRKQKWEDIINSYFPHKYKFYDQDKSAYIGSRDYDEDRSIRLKKVYKFLLMDKQRFQRYYSGGRMRHFQVKALARKAFRLTKNTHSTPVKSALSLLENRLPNLIYHLRFAPSLMDARHMILSQRFNVSGELIENCSHTLKKSDMISIDPASLTDIIGRYLLQTNLLYYFRSKKSRRHLLLKRKKTFFTSVVANNLSCFYGSFKNRLEAPHTMQNQKELERNLKQKSFTKRKNKTYKEAGQQNTSVRHLVKSINTLRSQSLKKKALGKLQCSLKFKDLFLSESDKVLIKKGKFLVAQKAFTKKINLNEIQGCQFSYQQAEQNWQLLCNAFQLKTSLYLLSKTLKNLKKATIFSSNNDFLLDSLDQFCFKLEKSGFYLSLTELEKKRKFTLLKTKIKKKLCESFLKPFNARKLLVEQAQPKIQLYHIKNPFQLFRKKGNKLACDLTNQKGFTFQNQKHFIRLKKDYSYITESRFLLYMAAYKKKYTALFPIMKRHKLKFRRLFFHYDIQKLRYTFCIKKRYKLYRSLVWKRKKKKNRKKVGLFYFLRKRPRMLFSFYVPRHLEINYKTFSLAHLGELDLSSINPRISFWLNLRRLLTTLAI